jgi:hypothetical protein
MLTALLGLRIVDIRLHSIAKSYNVEAGLPQYFMGISGEPIPGYFHTVKLQVMGLASMQVAVAFTDSPGVGALLSHTHKISFERYRE